MNQFKGNPMIRMALTKRCKEAKMTEEQTWKETMAWYAKNPEKTLEEAMSYYSRRKAEIGKTKNYNIESFQKVLKHK